MSQHAFAHRPPVGRIGVLSVEGRDAHGSDRHQRGLHELGDVCDAPHPARRVHQRDQPMGLAAAVGGIETEDRGDLAACASEAPSHVGEQIPEPPRRVGPGEEPGGVQVLRPAPARHDLRQVRREVGLGDHPLEDVLPWTRGLEDRRDGHGSRFALMSVVIRPDRTRSGSAFAAPCTGGFRHASPPGPGCSGSGGRTRRAPSPASHGRPSRRWTRPTGSAPAPPRPRGCAPEGGAIRPDDPQA